MSAHAPRPAGPADGRPPGSDNHDGNRRKIRALIAAAACLIAGGLLFSLVLLLDAFPVVAFPLLLIAAATVLLDRKRY